MCLVELWGTSDFDSNSSASRLVQVVNFIKKNSILILYYKVYLMGLIGIRNNTT
jgi:hypothetical protein